MGIGFEHDSEDGRRRREGLEDYISSNLLTSKREFICRSCNSTCRPSAQRSGQILVEGEMPHVGQYYSLRDGSGRTVRVVVMGEERGVPKSRKLGPSSGHRGASSVSVAERTEVILANRNALHRKANSHINGTVWGLVALFEAGPVAGRDETIIVGRHRVHVLEAFVLTNSTLCSAIGGTGKGKATPEMRATCAQHARAMLKILEPTHLLLQGASARAAVERAAGRSLLNEKVTSIQFGTTSCNVVTLNHPTSHEPTNWSGPSRGYFRTTVQPLLAAARM